MRIWLRESKPNLLAGGGFVWEGLGLDGVLVCMGLSGHGRELQKEVDGAFDW